MKGLVEYVARALVDRPEAVELTVTPQEGVMLYELKVSPEDIGKIIGRDGRTVNALRTVLASAAQKKGEKARLEVLDDRRKAGSAPSPAAPAPDAP